MFGAFRTKESVVTDTMSVTLTLITVAIICLMHHKKLLINNIPKYCLTAAFSGTETC